MADTVRTRSTLLSRYADNTSGDISPQDLRDGVVSWHALPNVVPVTADHGASTDRTTRANAVDAAITRAQNIGADFVMVPQEYGPGTDGYDASSVTFDNSIRMLREGQITDGFDVKAYGAAGDGSTDDSVAFDAAVSAAGSGGVVQVPDADFALDSTVEVVEASHLRIVGPGRLVFGSNLASSGGITPLIKINGGSDIGVIDLRFQGTGNSGVDHNDPGLQVLEDEDGKLMERLEVRGCEFEDFSTWGLRIQSGPFGGVQPDTVRTRDWRVVGNTFRNSFAGMIYGEGAGAIRGVVTENVFQGLAQNAVKLDGQLQAADGDVSGRVTITNNVFQDISGDNNTGTDLQAPIVLEEFVRGVVIEDNILADVSDTAAGADAAALWISDGASGANRPVESVRFAGNIMEDLSLANERIIKIGGSAAVHRDIVIEGNVLCDTFAGSFVVNVDAASLERLVVRNNVLHGLSGGTVNRVVSAGAAITTLLITDNVVGTCDLVLGATSAPVHRATVRGNTVVDAPRLVDVSASVAVDYLRVLDNELYQTSHGVTDTAINVSSTATGNDDDLIEILRNVLGPNGSSGSQTAIFVDAGDGRFRVDENTIHDGWDIGVQLQGGGAGGTVLFNTLGAMGTDGIRLNTGARLFGNKIESAGSFTVRNPGNATVLGMHSLLNYAGSMGASAKDPTSTAPDDWVEIEIAGTTHFLPAYLA